MADEAEFVEFNKFTSIDSLSSNDWTLINEVPHDGNLEDDNTQSFPENNGCSGAKSDVRNNDRQRIEVLEELNQGVIENRDARVVKRQSEESDDISIITESETELVAEKLRSSEIGEFKNPLCYTLKKYEKSNENSTPQIGTILSVMIACSLAAIIGLGAGRILSINEKCTVTDGIDYGTIKMESDMLINQLKELSEVKDVLDEIKANIPHVKTLKRKLSEEQDRERTSKKSKNSKKFVKFGNSYTSESDLAILEQLQKSLNTLSSAIDGVYEPENHFNTMDTSKTQDVITDIIIFKKILTSIIKELSDTDKATEVRFLRNAEEKIKKVCQLLLSDLSDTIRELVMKIHHKLNKVRHKLNKRMCMLRRTHNNESKYFKSLDENNLFLESCDKILDVTLKSYEKSQGFKKSECGKHSKFSKKSSEFMQEKQAAPMDEYFASKSSVPNLSYADIVKQNKDTVENNSQQKKIKVSKVAPEMNLQETNCPNFGGSNARIFKNIVLDTFSSDDVCPLPRQMPRSIQMDDSEKNSKEKVNRKMGGKVLETRHNNVTPPDNDTVVQSTKASKDQWNRNIRSARLNIDAAPKNQRDSTKDIDMKNNVETEKINANIFGPDISDKQVSSKSEKSFKDDKERNLKDLPNGEWQLQRWSNAREKMRDDDRASEWYFDRAQSRRYARKDFDQFYDYWVERKDMNFRKHASNRRGSGTKKSTNMPHRKEIFQTRR